MYVNAVLFMVPVTSGEPHSWAIRDYAGRIRMNRLAQANSAKVLNFEWCPGSDIRPYCPGHWTDVSVGDRHQAIGLKSVFTILRAQPNPRLRAQKGRPSIRRCVGGS